MGLAYLASFYISCSTRHIVLSVINLLLFSIFMQITFSAQLYDYIILLLLIKSCKQYNGRLQTYLENRVVKHTMLLIAPITLTGAIQFIL